MLGQTIYDVGQLLTAMQYSLIQLVQTLSAPGVVVSGPQHPHLHSSGSTTHPVIILFNALITGKRIIFLGHNRPAGQVSSYVLAACALGSGSGCVLRGFIARAFPYATLTNREEWESMSAISFVLPFYISSDWYVVLLDNSLQSRVHRRGDKSDL